MFGGKKTFEYPGNLHYELPVSILHKSSRLYKLKEISFSSQYPEHRIFYKLLAVKTCGSIYSLAKASIIH